MPYKKSQKGLKASSPTAKSETRNERGVGLPSDVALIRKEIKAFFESLDAEGNKVGGRKWGIYAFYDYDGNSCAAAVCVTGQFQKVAWVLTTTICWLNSRVPLFATASWPLRPQFRMPLTPTLTCELIAQVMPVDAV